MSPYRYIVTEQRSGVGRLVFNRPEIENRYNPEMMDEIRTAMDNFAEDPEVRAVVLTGAGEAFCAGADAEFMKRLQIITPDQIKRTIYRYFLGAVQAIKLCPKPTIAAIAGPAYTAGCEMAVATDFRIIAETAVFHEGWIKLGLVPPLGGMFLLPRLVGLGKATEMIMLGSYVDAEEAFRIGLATKLVAADDLQDAAESLARQLAAGPARAYSTAKTGLRRAMESSLAAEWEYNLQAQTLLISGPEFAEATTAADRGAEPDFTET